LDFWILPSNSRRMAAACSSAESNCISIRTWHVDVSFSSWLSLLTWSK
jgi:hypothetical protein